jgi:hypothetical protein
VFVVSNDFMAAPQDLSLTVTMISANRNASLIFRGISTLLCDPGAAFPQQDLV